MRRILTALLLIAAVGLCARGIPYAAPEFMMSIFDQFSHNYLNAEAAGRGNTGVALGGDVASVLQNPASLELKGARVYLEVFIKPSIEEMNKKPFENNRGDTYMLQNYNSTSPFGVAGFGARVTDNLQYAMLYTTLQSLEYNSFRREIQTDEILSLTPSYTHSQFVGAIASRNGEFSFGLNLMCDIYDIADYRSFWKVARQNATEYGFRAQPGVRWSHGPFALGASYTMSSDIDFALDYGENYTVTIPSIIAVGGAYSLGRARFIAEMEHEACSEQSSNFDDRTRLKFGIELTQGAYVARVGLMQSPGVFEGEIAFPSRPVDYSYSPYGPVEDDPATILEYEGEDYLVIEKNDQMFITCGLGYTHKFGAINLGVIADVNGDTPVTQLFSSFSLDLATLKSSLRRK